ncbi:MAG: hypothetical protein IPO21_21190 [Bacteroidales bacterium]|nr:hypothetical protein [Bacteroidales bacterium]
MIKYVMLLFSISLIACSQTNLGKADLFLTIHCKEVDPHEVVEYFAQLNLPKTKIKLQNDTIFFRCIPNFDSTHIAKLRKSGLKYEIYPIVTIPHTKYNDSLLGYSRGEILEVSEIDTNILKEVKKIPEIASLALQDEWFYWSKNTNMFNLNIVDKREVSVFSGDHINAISIGFEDERLVMEITHTKLGQKLFYEYTTKNTNKTVALFLQNNLIFNPTILEPINSTSVWITSVGEPSLFEAVVTSLFSTPFYDKVSIIDFDIK